MVITYVITINDKSYDITYDFSVAQGMLTFFNMMLTIFNNSLISSDKGLKKL